jgi:hypothetical protein
MSYLQPPGMGLSERNSKFSQWLRDNERAGWCDAFEAITDVEGNILDGLDLDDLIAIFLNLGPQNEAPSDDLVAMFSGLRM